MLSVRNVLKSRIGNTAIIHAKHVLYYSQFAPVLGDNTTRIGCSSGFWGDTAAAAPQLVYTGKIDFLVADYLSEITMSLLTAVKSKNSEAGFTPDFVRSMSTLVKDVKRKGIRVVTNAGGINPVACGRAVEAVAKKAGVDGVKVAVVTGDDLMKVKEKLLGDTREMFSGAQFPENMTSLTAYLGAGAIKQSLDEGADIVITGRCADSALALGPLMHTFKWSFGDFDKLASGSLAGHLIECGAQATGGVFTDWHKVPDWHKIGFPIVECAPSGDFVLTKPPNTGGIVTPATCAEQLVYEIGNPAEYILPDVVCDFSNVHMKELIPNEAVLIQGAKGRAPTDTYKVSGTYTDGYRLTAVCTIGGPKAAAKGRRTLEEILKRVKLIFKVLKFDDFTKVHIQALGAEDTYGENAMKGDGPREVVMWLAVHHSDKKALELLASEIAPAGTGMAPGLTGIVGGRPKASPVFKLYSFLHKKDKVNIEIHMDEKTVGYSADQNLRKAQTVSQKQQDVPQNPPSALETGGFSYKLIDLAYARSGDKGNHCNIGVIARDPKFVPYLRAALTEKAVQEYMSHVFDGASPTDSKVDRYELPGIHGFNFVLRDSLGGGGIASLRSDPQGKAFAQMLLDFELHNMPQLL